MSDGGNPTEPKVRSGRTSWFESRTIFAPFGRFRGDHVADREADGLLIGREAQRAQLITALLDNTHRGAYLVTGHRGSGKTTLVNHCLKEYEEAAYERYLNRHVGRAILWDRFALFVFVITLIFVFQALHDLLAIVAAGFPWKGAEPFLFLIKVGIVGILAIPLLNAWNILEFVVKAVGKSGKIVSDKILVSIVFFVVLAVALLMAVHPEVIWKASLIQFLMIMAASLPLLSMLGLSWERRWSRPLFVSTLAVLVAVGFSCLGANWRVWIGFAIQLILAGYMAHRGRQSDTEPEKVQQGKKIITFNLPLAVYLLLAIVTAVAIGDGVRISAYLGLVTAVLVVSLIAGVYSRIEDTRGQAHKPLTLMLLKAMSLSALSVQMMLPILVNFPEAVQLLGLCNSETGCNQDDVTRVVGNLGQGVTVSGFVFSSAVLFAIIFLLEFEWIARGRAEFRKDRPLVHGVIWSLGARVKNFDEGAVEPVESAGVDWQVVRSLEKGLFSLTFFYVIFQRWNPLLIVPVNLGFDALDHRRVIEAMLSCLKDQYSRAFTSWRSPIESLKVLGTVVLALYLTFALSFHAFYVNNDAIGLLTRNNYCSEALRPSGDVTRLGTDLTPVSIPPGMVVVCSVGGESLARLFQSNIFYRARRSENGVWAILSRSDLSPKLEIPETSTLSQIIQELGKSSPEQSEILTLRVYHLLSFILLLSILSYFTRRYWPYYRIVQQLQSLTASLSGKTREDHFELQSIWSRLAGVFLGQERKSLVEAEPLDPRAVEVWTLELMKKMQEFRLVLPYSTRHHLSLPAPEILFKLDELDKLGVGVIPEHDSSGPEVEPTQGLDLERRRSKALHSLFSEMKNLLSAGAARFVFIGGRTLHDEWLADLSARRPLLTNIFDVEIHLPSILTEDLEGRAQLRSDLNIRWLLYHTYKECKRNQYKADHSRSYYVHAAPEEEVLSRYSQAKRREIVLSEMGATLVLSWDQVGNLEPWQSTRLVNDFVDFLAYRSRGNPRRLLAMIESFLDASVNVRRSCGLIEKSKDVLEDDHALVFRDSDLYRIQLISEIYRRFRDALGMRLDLNDDKLVVGALYISDFLLKFHRRAFGWSNLQRVDELVHIHRAPDLPGVFSSIIDAWSERYLHSIRNGMYDYRFNSEFSRELRYLSRQSEEELAAVNFTLDESQALKTIYRTRFRQLQDDQAYEFIAALGELHEFDEEYEIARFYYRKAISYLDSRLKESLALRDADSPLHLVLMQDGDGLEIGRRRVNWALARLRLSLQVGMSYERSEDFEQAQAHYRNARTFAAAILRALLNAERSGKEVVLPLFPDRGRPDFISTLKHFNLLFQPVHAEAWICEKLRGGVDTSMRVIERSIWEVRWILPAAREEFDGGNIALAAGGLRSFRRQHLNFYLTMAEQHNKVGDLLFYKACPSVLPIVKKSGDGVRKRLADFGGFLGRAHYHYALSLHELRSFVSLRLERGRRLQYPNWEVDLEDVSPSMRWPDFVVDASSHCLADLADTLISRVSLRDCMRGGSELSADTVTETMERQRMNLSTGGEEFKKWLERIPRGVPEESEEVCWPEVVNGIIQVDGGPPMLHSVLGLRTAVLPDESDKVEMSKVDRLEAKQLESEFARASEWWEQKRYKSIAEGDVQALITLDLELGGPSLLGYYATFLFAASDILEEGGHFEDAARKASRVVEMAALYVFMARAVKWIRESAAGAARDPWLDYFGQASEANETIRQLAVLGMVAAEKSCWLFKKARHRIVASAGDKDAPKLKAGRLIPTSLCAHICSLGLHSLGLFKDPDITPLLKLLPEYFGGELKKTGSELQLKEALITTLENNAYPILGRLHGLKVLADDQILSGVPLEERPSYLDELAATAEAFDSPLHFTPFHLGTTRALSVLSVATPEEATIFEALETLRKSIAMYSMQITFYRTIDNLYYLHDDFNDRRVHSCHALQMAGAELTELLKERLERLLGAPTYGLGSKQNSAKTQEDSASMANG